jgi:propionyl-CoA carboxylase beta chain
MGIDLKLLELANKPYDMKEILNSVLDDNVFFKIARDYAKNIIIEFGRLNGASVGIVANQPNYLT